MSTALPGANPAVLSGPDGLDPRNSLSQREADFQLMDNDYIDSSMNSQPLDVYIYWADREREREALSEDDGVTGWTHILQYLTGKGGKKANKTKGDVVVDNRAQSSSPDFGKEEKKAEDKGTTTVVITESERYHAYKALRTASWQGAFFLITTDILGPSSAPYALAELGYGGGILVYTAFFALAVAAGQVIWRLYCKLDSSRYPVKNYSDIGERLIGRWFRHLSNIIQSLQLFLNVGILILGNGQTLATIINYKFCFVALNVFFALFGGIIGQIRSLRNLSWIANLNIWINIVVILMAIVGCSIYAPVPTLNFPTLTEPYPPVSHTAFGTAQMLLDQLGGPTWYNQVNGVIYAVFAYGGAMIFVEFMAEMKKPYTFWKAAISAQLFIWIVYLVYGCVIYHAQGQYSYIIPTLSIAKESFQIAVNVLGLIGAIIAAMLYGNIGVKVFYFNVLQAYCKAPSLTSPRGRYLWTATVCVYWALAFVISSAIPQLSSMTVLVGALCILQFTYTFPPILWCCYLFQLDAMEGEEEWQPGMEPGSNRIDTWRQMSRWRRGFKRNAPFKVFLVILFLAALALCGLGTYAGVESIIQTFASAGSATSFSCRAPGQPADS